MRRIFDDEITSLMSVQDMVNSCHEAFRLYGLGHMANPARKEQVIKEGSLDLFRLEMPGEWPGHFCGRKVIEERSDVKRGRLGIRTAFFELEDLKTGQQAILDAEWITNMRTGAAGALGVHYLAHKPVHTVAVLGTGRIAQALVLCCDVLLHPQVIRVTSRSHDRRRAFVQTITPQIQAHLEAVDDITSCVKDAQAILTAVPTPNPVLFGNQIAKDAHISVMGGDGRTRQLDRALFLSRLVIPDHAEQVLKSGEFLDAKNAQKEICWVYDEKKCIQTVGDAALGHLEKLRGQGGIVYFSGMAVQDLHAAATVWQRVNSVL